MAEAIQISHQNLVPILSHQCTESTSSFLTNDASAPIYPVDSLSSFPFLRSRNLLTLYGTSQTPGSVTTGSNNDKSPKGTVDEKIRPLIDLINLHPEYVTLSSCSGRITLFDPTGDVESSSFGNHFNYVDAMDHTNSDPLERDSLVSDIYHHYHELEYDTRTCNEAVNYHEKDESSIQKPVKSTMVSGKGRGKWVFITHDVLPDLSQQIIQSLREFGKKRFTRKSQTSNKNYMERTHFEESLITFKYEPPLLHIAASSINAGKRILHILKSVCSMRESGLVVTDQRVTVEVRTTGSILCLPLKIVSSLSMNLDADDKTVSTPDRHFALQPNEDYLMTLACMANERMMQNDLILEKMYRALKDTLFQEKVIESQNDLKDSNNEFLNNNIEKNGLSELRYEVTLQPLPPMNLWKTAAVVIPCHDSEASNDVDVLAFGGQGIGPNVNGGNELTTLCRRWDSVFRLARRNEVWSMNWEIVPLKETNDESLYGENLSCPGKTTLITHSGTFQVHTVSSFGKREGHAACVLPLLSSTRLSTDVIKEHAVIIFGGRTGGPLSPSNDLFLFTLHRNLCNNCEKTFGLMGKPIDIRGRPPEPRFGHSMTTLRSNLEQSEPLAIISGGVGAHTIREADATDGSSITFSSVYVLSRVGEDNSGICHFVWERISDMQVPRAYHTSSEVSLKSRNFIFIFGGLSKPDDPFDPFDCNETTNNSRPVFEILESWKSSMDNIREKDVVAKCSFALPSLIGSSAATFAVPTLSTDESFVLLTGGVKFFQQKCRTLETLQILQLKDDQHEVHVNTLAAKVSLHQSSESKMIDVGICVHHSLVTLPLSARDIKSNLISTTISVGGGVPSFCFGQLYADSYLVTVRHELSPQKNLETDVASSKVSRSSSKTKEETQTLNIDSSETDVIYVDLLDASKVKRNLARLGYLDKRYKIVRTTFDSSLVAIPVTPPCLTYVTNQGESHQEGSVQLTFLFDVFLRGTGKERVPLSSSSIGKMKQRRWI